MNTLNKEYQYFGVELEALTSFHYGKEEVHIKEAVLRGPDHVFKVYHSKGEKPSYLLLWRSWGNCVDEWGRVGVENPPEGMIPMPLRVVFYPFVKHIWHVYGYISIVPDNGRNKLLATDLPRNLDMLALTRNCGMVPFRVVTHEQLTALLFTAETKFEPCPTWTAPERLIAECAVDNLKGAMHILKKINSEEDCEYLYREFSDRLRLTTYFWGYFKKRAREASRLLHEVEEAERELVKTEWYSKSQMRKRRYPAGLVMEYREKKDRFVLYDFEAPRRLMLVQTDKESYVTPAHKSVKGKLLRYNAQRQEHLLPPNVTVDKLLCTDGRMLYIKQGYGMIWQ